MINTSSIYIASAEFDCVLEWDSATLLQLEPPQRFEVQGKAMTFASCGKTFAVFTEKSMKGSRSQPEFLRLI